MNFKKLLIAGLLGTTVAQGSFTETAESTTQGSAEQNWIQAKNDKNPERMLELWRIQQTLNAEAGCVSGVLDKGYVIEPDAIHLTLSRAANEAEKDENPERMLELLRMQQRFTKELGVEWLPLRGVIAGKYVTTYSIIMAFENALNRAIDPARIVSLYETYVGFKDEFEADEKYTFERFDRQRLFKKKYEEAKESLQSNKG